VVERARRDHRRRKLKLCTVPARTAGTALYFRRGFQNMHRVLCIEGDESVRAMMRRLLEADGFAVEEAGTALEGIERALALTPDLVVADTHLPDLAGPELTARLRQEPALQRVPFVSVGLVPDEQDVAIAAGADGFVQQPLDPAGFAAEIRSYLQGRHETLTEERERRGLRALSATLAQHLESVVVSESRARERLAQSDRLRSAFMHDVAHELSTPLTPLAGYVKILQSDKLGPLAPQQRKVVDAMSTAVTKLARIIDNLSDFATLQAGQATLLQGAVDPDALVDDIVEELRPGAREARIQIEVKTARVGPIQADRRKLRQALANVIGNAVKFSPHGGEVLIEVTRDPGRLRIAVYDQGPGIAPGDTGHVFEPFFHAARPRWEEARQPGSGLGLPVARRIVEAHGGRIVVESPPLTQPASTTRHFTGCKFLIELPAIAAVQPQVRASST
jgi:signal transduction histidine kinase